jgi:hypothetical protein
MTSFLTILAIAASNAVSGNCAAITNLTNEVAWKQYSVARVGHATYRDLGDRLRWSRKVPVVVKMSAATLRVGNPGFKVRVACNIILTK